MRPWPLALLALAACAPHPYPYPYPHPNSHPVPVPVPVPSPALTAESPSASLPPAFPAGWIQAAAPSPVARSRLKQLLDLDPRRTTVAPVAFRVNDLPLVEVPPPLAWSSEPTAPPSDEEAKELVIFKSARGSWDSESTGYLARVSVRNRAFGFMEVSGQAQPIGPWADGGVEISCGTRGGTGWRPAEWQTLSAGPDGSLRYEEVRLWFDHQACKGWVMQRIEARAMPFAAGLAYGFRASCPRCAPDRREQLHILTPASRSARMPFQHLVMFLREGSSGADRSSFSPDDIAFWKQSGARPEREKATRFGFEVARAHGEPEPVAIFFVGDQEPPGR
jgi:hypothetical protein